MQWQPFAYLFRAPSPATTVRIFDVTEEGSGGIVLDGLVVELVDAPTPGLAPASPTGLVVRLISPTQVDLAWTDASADETGFEIQRRTGAGEWSRIALVGENVNRFSDFGVRPGTAYAYRVRAQNDAGASDWSNEAGGTTLGGP
jgi:hypothetical protein